MTTLLTESGQNDGIGHWEAQKVVQKQVIELREAQKVVQKQVIGLREAQKVVQKRVIGPGLPKKRRFPAQRRFPDHREARRRLRLHACHRVLLLVYGGVPGVYPGWCTGSCTTLVVYPALHYPALCTLVGAVPTTGLGVYTTRVVPRVVLGLVPLQSQVFPME